jgi:hypothetical protein
MIHSRGMTLKKKPTKPIPFRPPPDLKKKLEQKAGETGLSQNAILILALKDYLR